MRAEPTANLGPRVKCLCAATAPGTPVGALTPQQEVESGRVRTNLDAPPVVSAALPSGQTAWGLGGGLRSPGFPFNS